MKLSTNAKIFMQDGREIGNLNRFVMDPKSKRVTDIIFVHGMLTQKEYVLPIQFVDHIDETGIHLRNLPVNGPEELTPFEERDYIVTSERGLLNQGYVSDEMVRSYYYYPSSPFGGSGMMRPLEMYVGGTADSSPIPGQPEIPVSGDPPVRKEVERNIPEGTVALKEGAKVITSDSRHIGNVEKVFVDPRSTKASHLLITKGLLLKERKLIPADWVDNITEDEVYLAIDGDFANRLPDYKEG